MLVNDALGLTDASRFILFGRSIDNNPPEAADDSGIGFTTDEETPFATASVLSNDRDANVDGLSVIGFDTTGTRGQVIDNGDSTFSYNPNGQPTAATAPPQTASPSSRLWARVGSPGSEKEKVVSAACSETKHTG